LSEKEKKRETLHVNKTDIKPGITCDMTTKNNAPVLFEIETW